MMTFCQNLGGFLEGIHLNPGYAPASSLQRHLNYITGGVFAVDFEQKQPVKRTLKNNCCLFCL